MLTRCKKGMTIITNHRFLELQARQTLIGQMASYWTEAVGEREAWLDYKDVARGYVDVPGVKGNPPQREPTPPPKPQVRFQLLISIHSLYYNELL